MSSFIDLAALEDLFSTAYPPDQPGAAVIITQDGQPLFRKGYGMANIELGVPIQPETVFRIASITKQFTAVSILMLMEQGLLRLDDPIEAFLPDYPVHGHTITIEHLLTHTSGIKNNTSMPEFQKVKTCDMTPQEMVDFFKHQPMEFAPGKRWNYSNSGYFLLGVIIEKLSGLTYADFLQQRIFDPLGLAHTCCDSPTRIIPNRASGYTKQGETLVNDSYISTTPLFSAGGLASTIDDLATWDESLYSGRLVSRESLQRAWMPYRLTDGATVHYGYGWSPHEYQGHPWIEHGGEINGFLCFAIRLTEQHLYVAVLTNTTAPAHSQQEIATRAAALALGQAIEDPRAVEWSTDAAVGLSGVFQTRPGEEFNLSVMDGKLKLTLVGGPDFLLYPIGEDRFAGESVGVNQLYLCRNASGQVTSFELRNIFGEVALTGHRIE